MANILEPEDIEWQFVESIAFSTHHHATLRDDTLGIQLEQVSRVKSDGGFGSPKRYYFIDGCDKEMTDLQDLCDTWNELKDFDDPQKEIIWVKIKRVKDKYKDFIGTNPQ